MLPSPFDDRPGRTRTKLMLLFGALAVANLASWAWAGWALAATPALLATALLAYSFGLRHAFDADHIAAIDNVVRKLGQEGKRAHSAGLFFSLGHSTVVVLACAAIAAGASRLGGASLPVFLANGIVGTAVSALFLLVISIINLTIFLRLLAQFRLARRGLGAAETGIESLLDGRGLLARCFRPLFRIVTRSWHMYGIGFLFGLGFDTATEVGMLGISAAQAAHDMPTWTIMLFPLLFAAGMTLVDTADSALMTGAYGWAFLTPARKLGYNLAVTGLSVVAALVVGGVEALALIGGQLDLRGGWWHAVAQTNAGLGGAGGAIAALLLATWLVSAAASRATTAR